MSVSHEGAGHQPGLASWLVTHLGLSEPLVVRQVAGGRSNVTSVVSDGEHEPVVVRRPPDGTHAGGAHDVLREARILAALEHEHVPTPRVLATVEAAPGVGWPFYVMEYLPGPVVDKVEVLTSLSVDTRRTLSCELVDALISLQSVDVDAVGLGDLRRTAPYVERQVQRWRSQWERTATRELPLVHRVAARLESRIPKLKPVPDCLVHGDFRFGNVILGPGDQPRIAAVLDWELANVGHPLNDVAYLGARVLVPAEVLVDGVDPLSAPGMPSFGELVEHYVAHGGADVTDLPFFIALNAWRWAIIVEGIVKRYAAGEMGRTASTWQPACARGAAGGLRGRVARRLNVRPGTPGEPRVMGPGAVLEEGPSTASARMLRCTSEVPA